jgi:hypothetical protein
MTASVGRMDMMSAALNVAAFAAYMNLRKRGLAQAILVGNALTAISVFTHPTGVFGCVGLLFLTIYFDWKQIKFRHLAVAAIPYLIGAGLWSIYIFQSPSLFLSQFGGNVDGVHQTNRWAGLTSPLKSLGDEVALRYLEFYGFGSDSSGMARLKIFILLAYFGGFIVAVFTPQIRRHKDYRALLLLAAIYFLLLWLLDGHKQVMYLIHIIPLFAVVFAVSVHWYYFNQIRSKWLLIAGVVCLTALQIGGVLYVIKKDDYRRTYLPAIEFIKADLDAENNLIMGSAEFGFGLEFPDNFIDDWRLGFHSRKKPDLIVVGKQYEGMFNGLSKSEPETYRHITELLSEQYNQVYDYNSIKIYKRK